MQFCAHDVAAVCRLAEADARVRLPLGAFGIAQNSGVAQSVGRLPVKETGEGSNPSAGANQNKNRVLGRSAEAPNFQSGQAGSIPAGHSIGAGQFLSVEIRGFEPRVRRFDSCPRSFREPTADVCVCRNRSLRDSCCW